MKKLSEVFSEQHREKGRFKPTIPRMVPNKTGASPRPTSDSANVSLKERCWPGYKPAPGKKAYAKGSCVKEANAAAIAAATAISKKKSGNYDKEGMRKTPYKNPDHPNVKSNEQRRKEMNEEMGGKQEMQVQGTAAMTLTDKPNKEPMKTYKELKNITELSTDLLHRYKEKAAADATKADKEGDIARGNKRFSGVVKATNKQFANFKKKGFNEDVTKKPEAFKTIKPKENEHETYYKFVSGKAKMGKALSNKEKDFVKSYKLMKQEEVEQIDEISAQAHKEYQAAARKDVAALSKHTGGEYGDIAKNIMKRRMKGLSTSTALQHRDTMMKVKKEEVEQIDEDKYDRMLNKMLKGKSGERLLKKHSAEVKKSNDIESGKALEKHIKKNPGVLKTHNKAVKRDKKLYGEEVEQIDEKNVPTSPEKWAQAKAQAKAKFDVYPSAYANGWAAKKYKAMGGGWKSVSEAVKDKFDIGEYDQEGDMAKSDLRSIMANAKKLHDMIEDADNLPEWCQNKITLAEDYISTVANYLTAEMNEEVEQIDELSKSTKESKEDLPFTPDKPKKQSAVAGKYGKEYSTARHLARMAMQKQVEKMKKAPIKEETRKAAIVKDIMKKKKGSEDAFQKDPELSNTLTKV